MSKEKEEWVLYLGPVADTTWYVQLHHKPSLVNRIAAKLVGLNYVKQNSNNVGKL